MINYHNKMYEHYEEDFLTVMRHTKCDREIAIKSVANTSNLFEAIDYAFTSMGLPTQSKKNRK